MIEIAVNIGVVEFDAGQDDMARPVVEKLRPLIKKRRVILVALEHHVLARAGVPAASQN